MSAPRSGESANGAAAELAQALAGATRGVVLAPAGFGKTHLIADALAAGGGRQLVLTHTHAGVASLRQRFKKRGIDPSKFHLDTLAAWSLRVAKCFPASAGLQTEQPTGAEWPSIYAGVTRTLAGRGVRKILASTYSGVYVDEYQDCTASQHALVLSLADVLSCRVLGDPLQAIFDFRSEPSVDWQADVDSCFDTLPAPTTPWRWLDTNPALGNWLMTARDSICDDGVARLDPEVVRWVSTAGEAGRDRRRKACFDAGNRAGSVLLIATRPEESRHLGRSLAGRFSCIEAVELDDLFTIASKLDSIEGPQLGALLVELAAKCRTKVSQALKAPLTQLKCGKLPQVARYRKFKSQVEALVRVAADGHPSALLAAWDEVSGIDGSRLFRRELGRDFRRTIELVRDGEHASYADAAWSVRNRLRTQGRQVPRCGIGTTLLVKGLEFDHVVVLDGSALDARHLYVALSRARYSLTVCAPSREVVARKRR